jgi:predicted enzyme related to lactoylglutathione lyase
MKMASVMIGSSDATKMIEYYRKLFGTPTMEQEDFAGWDVGGGWVVIGPHDGVKGANEQPGRVMWNLDSEDVKADFERLRDAGAIVVKEPYAPEGPGAEEMSIATFSDPDGNYFQLMSSM